MRRALCHGVALGFRLGCTMLLRRRAGRASLIRRTLCARRHLSRPSATLAPVTQPAPGSLRPANSPSQEVHLRSSRITTPHRSVSRRPVCVLRAQALRASATPSEQALWRALRSSQLGVRFRRQVPIARFIVDFLAPQIRSSLKLTAGYHRVRRATDARRDPRRSAPGVLRAQAGCGAG